MPYNTDIDGDEMNTHVPQSQVMRAENKINQVLNKARDDAGSSTHKSLADNNNLEAMATLRSKGRFNNILQMATYVGQQNEEAKRISFGFKANLYPSS